MTKEEAAEKARTRFGVASIQLIEDFAPPASLPCWTAAPLGPMAFKIPVARTRDGLPVFIVPACGATWEDAFANADCAEKFAREVANAAVADAKKRKAAEEGGSLN